MKTPTQTSFWSSFWPFAHVERKRALRTGVPLVLYEPEERLAGHKLSNWVAFSEAITPLHELVPDDVERKREVRELDATIDLFVRNLALGGMKGPQRETESLGLLREEARRLDEIFLRIDRVETLLKAVAGRIEEQAATEKPLWVPIDSFTPEPYEVVRPITAIVTPAGDGYEARFVDGNFHGWGDTVEEAVADLKTEILDAFDRLTGLRDEELGGAVRRQKAVLTTFMRRI